MLEKTLEDVGKIQGEPGQVWLTFSGPRVVQATNVITLWPTVYVQMSIIGNEESDQKWEPG